MIRVVQPSQVYNRINMQNDNPMNALILILPKRRNELQ
jgi:hypothetical protein